MAKERKKPYLESLRRKHPTVEADAQAYASGAQKTFDAEYNEFIRNVETVDRAIRTIANIASLATFKTYSKNDKGERKPAKIKNVDLELINETDSSVDFLRKLFVSIFSQGAGVIVTEEGTRVSGESLINFYSLDVARVSVESDGKALLSEFVYQSELGDELRYDANKVIYINDSIDPSNLLYSLSRLKSLNDVILMQAGIVRSTKELASGGAKDSHIISSEAPISERNMEKIKAAFDAFTASAGSSSLFMNTGLNVHKVGNSMSGAEMLNFFSKLNEIMLSQFNLPTFLLGDYSKTGANKNEELLYALRVFFTTQMRPVFKNIALQFTKFFREQLQIKNVTVEFSFDEIDILDEPIEAKTERALKLNKQGLISINEAREMVELSPLDAEAANKHFLPAYLLSSVPVSVESYDDEMERFLMTQGSSNGGDEPEMPSGASGDEDNTNVETDSRGGSQEGT